MTKSLKILNQNRLLQTSKAGIEAQDDEEFKTFLNLARLPSVKRLYLDTESNGQTLKDERGHAIGTSIDFSIDGEFGYSYYFPFRHKSDNLSFSYRDGIRDLIQEGKHEIVAHHYRHDALALKSLGIQVPGLNFRCTMLLVHDCDENKLSYRLDYISRELGLPGKARDKHFDNCIKLLGWDGMPPSSMSEYASTDASLLRPIMGHYEPIYLAEDETNGKRLEYDKKFMLLLNKIELNGIKVDLKLAERKIEEGEKRLQEIQNELGMNPNSNTDLKKLLIDDLGLPIVKTSPKTGKPSFDKKAMEIYEPMLERSQSPVAKLVLEYRGYNKAVSTYWKSYLTHVSPDGRIRPNFNLHRTNSRRLSCDSPNGQNIPKVSDKPWSQDVKQGFIPEEDCGLWEADYAQLEFRLGAAYGHQDDLIAIFDDPERDIFTEMSVALAMSRFDTKTLNYSLQYGAGVKRISEAFNVPPARATRIRDNYFNTYPGLAKATKLAARAAINQGFIRTWTGRRRHFQNPRLEAHKAFNAVVQSGAADIVKRQMLRLDEELPADCRMVLQIHDSIVFEIPKGKEIIYGPQIIQIMEDVRPNFGVKFKVDFHKWGT